MLSRRRSIVLSQPVEGLQQSVEKGLLPELLEIGVQGKMHNWIR
jgi:hypothetical protein